MKLSHLIIAIVILIADLTLNAQLTSLKDVAKVISDSLGLIPGEKNQPQTQGDPNLGEFKSDEFKAETTAIYKGSISAETNPQLRLVTPTNSSHGKR